MFVFVTILLLVVVECCCCCVLSRFAKCQLHWHSYLVCAIHTVHTPRGKTVRARYHDRIYTDALSFPFASQFFASLFFYSSFAAVLCCLVVIKFAFSSAFVVVLYLLLSVECYFNSVWNFLHAKTGAIDKLIFGTFDTFTKSDKQISHYYISCHNILPLHCCRQIGYWLIGVFT